MTFVFIQMTFLCYVYLFKQCCILVKKLVDWKACKPSTHYMSDIND